MDRFHAMKVFSRVAEMGSFSRAADALNLGNGTVSTVVRQLEQHLGVRLLARNTRGISLTDDGRVYLDRCRGILAEVEETEAALASSCCLPQGRLRVSMPLALGRAFCAPGERGFQSLYPDIRLTAVLEDRIVNLIEDGIDAAVRFGALADSSLVARRVYETRTVAVAAPEYLKRRGVPNSPAELKDHLCLGYYSVNSRQTVPWAFERSGREAMHQVDGPLSVNSIDLLIDAALKGIGIVYVLEMEVRELIAAGRLCPVLADWSTRAIPISVVYPHSRHLCATTRVFVDFIADLLER